MVAPGHAEPMTTILSTGQVGLLGLPTDEASSFERGAAQGPAAARAALHSDSSNLMSELGIDLGESESFVDLGDLTLSGGAETRAEIEAGVAAQLEQGGQLISLGGDHSVAYPILRAYGPRHEGLTVIQIDAHPDLYDNFEGDRYSHACPFARVMEEGLVRRLIQVGIRTATAHQLEQAERFGVEIVPRATWTGIERLALEPPVYLSIDLDGFDPAFAPGVAHPEAGGLTSREGLDYVWRVPGLVGADVVELNPKQDPGGLTAGLAAKLIKELAGRMLSRRPER